MKPSFLYIAVPLLALVAGWVSGPAGETAGAAGPSAGDKNGRGTRGEGKPWNEEDFIRSFSAARSAVAGDEADPLVAYLEKWTDAEIRAALDESLRDPELLLGEGGSTGVTRNLFRQLIARDFTAATAWFAGLPENQKTELTGTLLWNWPAERTEEGMAFIRANKLLAAGNERSIVTRYMNEVAKRGAKEFMAALQAVEAEGFNVSYSSRHTFHAGLTPGLTLPVGFDYPTLFAPEGMGFQPKSYGSFTNAVFGQWQKQDRDASFQWIMEHHGIPALSLVSGGWGGDDAGAWFNGKLTAMPGEQRAGFLRGRLDLWTSDPSSAIRMVAAARDTPIYQEVLAHGVQGLFRGHYSGCLSMIEGIREPEERVRFLENLERVPTGYSNRWQDRGEELSFRRSLLEWGADEARANAIIDRLKNGGEGE